MKNAEIKSESEVQRFIELPRIIVEEDNAIEKLAGVIDELKLSGKAIVVSGVNTFSIAGKRVEEIVSKEFETEVFLAEKASIAYVKALEEKIEKENASFCIAAGGGKVIDVCKLASFRKGIPFISIPTSAAHDGIASPRASIKQSKTSVSVKAGAPIAVIADINIISKAPYRLIASGAGDVIAKITALKDWELARDELGEEYSSYAAALCEMSYKMVLDSEEKIKNREKEGVKNLVKALISCGVAISIAGSSRPASGSEHKFSHALDMLCESRALHGEQCGVGTIIAAKLHGIEWQRIREFLENIRAPVNAEGLGVSEKCIVEAIVKAREINKERFTIFDKIKPDKSMAEKIAKEVRVIK